MRDSGFRDIINNIMASTHIYECKDCSMPTQKYHIHETIGSNKQRIKHILRHHNPNEYLILKLKDNSSKLFFKIESKSKQDENKIKIESKSKSKPKPNQNENENENENEYSLYPNLKPYIKKNDLYIALSGSVFPTTKAMFKWKGRSYLGSATLNDSNDIYVCGLFVVVNELDGTTRRKDIENEVTKYIYTKSMEAWNKDRNIKPKHDSMHGIPSFSSWHVDYTAKPKNKLVYLSIDNYHRLRELGDDINITLNKILDDKKRYDDAISQIKILNIKLGITP